MELQMNAEWTATGMKTLLCGTPMDADANGNTCVFCSVQGWEDMSESR